MAEERTPIESAKDFTNDSVGWAARWHVEMQAAKRDQESFQERGEKVVARFLDNRSGDKREGDTRVNLFSANVATLRALLYGKLPTVDVKRRWADPGDDTARVAAEVLQRLLNTDIERDDDSYTRALENCLDDRLLPGLAVVRLRYEAEFEDVEVPPIYREESADDKQAAHPLAGQEVLDERTAPQPPSEPVILAPGYTKKVKVHEDVDTDYIHWRDFRWSPARTWDEVRWVAFRTYLTKDDIAKRFGKEVAELVPRVLKTTDNKIQDDDGLKNHPWSRAQVWEIWDKATRKVYWWCEGYSRILDQKDDPLGLEGFWPMPKPMFANSTTTKLIPTPDFTLAQDLYDEVDTISTRITLLERAVAVRGVYDKADDSVKRIISEAVENELIGVENFALFKEKGGLQGVVDWMPLDMIVNALQVLRDYRTELMSLLFQVTGMSDIMRGQSTQGATATEQALKAKFASTRVQELQNEFARFASDCLKIKAEIIAKFFDPQTILTRSNVQYMTGSDPQIAMKAIGIIKQDIYQYRIEVKPESVAMADMAAVKQERSEFLMAMSQFFQNMVPVVQVAPYAAPYMLQMLQWAIAGFKGSSNIEGVLDQMVLAAQQDIQQKMLQPPPPDPKIEQLRMKAALDQQSAQMDMVTKQADLKMKQQAAMADVSKKYMELQLKAQEHQQKMAAQQDEHALDIRKMETDAIQTAVKGNMELQQAQETGRMERAAAADKMQMEREGHKQKLQMQKEQAKAQAAAARQKPKPKGGKS